MNLHQVQAAQNINRVRLLGLIDNDGTFGHQRMLNRFHDFDEPHPNWLAERWCNVALKSSDFAMREFGRGNPTTLQCTGKHKAEK